MITSHGARPSARRGSSANPRLYGQRPHVLRREVDSAPWIAFLHGVTTRSRASRSTIAREPRRASRDRVIVMSEPDATRLVDAGGRPHASSHRATMPRFTASARKGLARPHRHWTNTGCRRAASALKGRRRRLASAELISQAHPRVKLHVGETVQSGKPGVPRQRSRPHGSHRLAHGHVARHHVDLPAVDAADDPSRSEGLPNAALEARQPQVCRGVHSCRVDWPNSSLTVGRVCSPRPRTLRPLPKPSRSFSTSRRTFVGSRAQRVRMFGMRTFSVSARIRTPQRAVRGARPTVRAVCLPGSL